MTNDDPASRRETNTAENVGEFLLTAVFGDRTGVTIFLGALAFFMLYWRVGFFSTDSYAVANSMAAVADGHLYIDRIVYGPDSGVTPGMHVFEGRLYGRNYGEVFLALPILFFLKTLAVIADARIALAGLWCLILLGGITLVGERVNRRGRALALGSVACFALFAAHVAVARPLDPYWFPLMALQLAAMTAAGLLAVFIYRLIARIHGERIGILAGAGTFLATPVGFWASIPKRHSFTALLAILVLYSFHRSRDANTKRKATGFRALAYGWVGVASWVHAGEGLILLVGLVATDLLTAPRNDVRHLAVVVGVFGLSLVPFLATNELIAGDPFRPPRLLPNYHGSEEVLLGGEAAPGGRKDGATPAGQTTPSGKGAKTPQTGGTGPIEGIRSAIWSLVGVLVSLPGAIVNTGLDLATVSADRVELLITYLNRSVDDWFDSDLLYHVFLRSGYMDVRPEYDRAINLAVLESMPLLGASIAAPLRLWYRLESNREISRTALTPERATDLLAVIYLVLIATLYLDRFPLHHMLTVRYLHPIYPIGMYALARLDIVRRTCQTRARLLLLSYGGTLLLAIPGYIAALTFTDAVLGEAVQIYAITAFVIGIGVAFWVIVESLRGDHESAGAVVLGIAAAAMTTYLLVSGFGFFAFTDEFVLPGSRVVAEILRFINPLRSLW